MDALYPGGATFGFKDDILIDCDELLNKSETDETNKRRSLRKKR